MISVAELKDLIPLHIATQDVPRERFLTLLEKIERDGDPGPGDWATEWLGFGDQLVSEGRSGAAIQAFNFGRFPFPNSPQRKAAHRRCLEVFEQSVLLRHPDIVRKKIQYGNETFPVYARGEPGPKRPLLLVMGGIVSLKEQWSSSLLDGSKLGFAVCVAEFPGAGENPLCYSSESAACIGAILDDLIGESDCAVYMVAISFSGHLALKHVARDHRIRGVILSGAPVRQFFIDTSWLAQVPQTTVETLIHHTGVKPGALLERLAQMALSAELLRQISVPVLSLCATRDEIIPMADTRLLQECLPQLRVVELEDVHGAPHHMPLIKKLIPLTLLQFSGRGKSPIAWVLRLIVGVLLFRARLMAPRMRPALGAGAVLSANRLEKKLMKS